MNFLRNFQKRIRSESQRIQYVDFLNRTRHLDLDPTQKHLVFKY